MFMNRKGQALVEFVMILPVLLLILLAIIDFGIITYSKNEVQNQSVDVVRMINNGNSLNDIASEYKDLNIKVEEYKEDYQKVILTKKINLVTPFLDNILGKPYLIEVERVIPNAK